MSKASELNPRQRKFLKFYLETGNASASARRAGYKDFITTPYKILENARFQSAYEELMDKQGITDKKLLRVLSEGLDAKKLVYVENGSDLNKQGNPKKTQEFDDDYSTRHKYLETGLELRGRLNKNKDELASSPTSVTVQVIHVRRDSNLSGPSQRKGSERDRAVSEAIESPGQHGEITSLVRRVSVG